MINRKFFILTSLAAISYAISDILIKISHWVEGVELVLKGNSLGLVYLFIFGFSLIFTLLNKIIASKILSEYPLGLAQSTGIPFIILLIVFIGIIFFDEAYSFLKVVGIFFIIIGVVIVNLNSDVESAV